MRYPEQGSTTLQIGKGHLAPPIKTSFLVLTAWDQLKPKQISAASIMNCEIRGMMVNSVQAQKASIDLDVEFRRNLTHLAQ